MTHYLLFLEFRSGDVVRTAAFTVRVRSDDGTTPVPDRPEHDHGG